MLSVAVLVCGDGANLQAVIDAQKNGIIADARIGLVVSNVEGAAALEVAAKAGVKGIVMAEKDYADVKAW